MAPATFASSKSWATSLVIWGAVVLLLALLVQELQSDLPVLGKVALGAFCVALIGFLLWTWFGTYYRISGAVLYYRCGPFNGQIPIQQIRKISLNSYLWAGMRPALGFRGLVVYYNRWDEIYISPAEREKFIEALLQVNPEIEVE